MSAKATSEPDRLHYRTTILPSSGWSLPDFHELIRYRDLLKILTARNISLIYRQSILGVGWAIVRPLITTIIFSLIFGHFAGFDQTQKVAYPIFILTGLVLWNFFASSLANASESVVSQSHILTKIYFPRLILPLSALGVAVVDFLIQFAILVVLMVIYGVAVSTYAPVAILFLIAASLVSFSMSVWLTALNVRFRDIKHTVPFLIQTLLYLTPVIYPVEIVPQRWQWLLHLNPMFSVVQGFRWSLLGTEPPNWTWFSISMLLTTFLLLTGLVFFRRTESTFADIV
tara:strand:- start:24313 stop:25170 length:858 start_codon:yes stop_codon:yes gene_type:complete